MKYAVWGLQIFLAFSFIAAGASKLAFPRTQLIANGQTWAEDFSDTQVKLIGAAEAAGGIGLIVPAATGIAPMLTPVAAAGLAVVMGGAVATHLRRAEPPTPAMVLGVLALLAAVLTYRRLARRPMTA
jgi:VIT1/CCC1 family predicted Fe2+/Mn2+ transporter